MKVSVIIPVYKAEQFLEKSVKSASDLDEVQEILLVEDGSPDRSLEIAQELELKFSKVRLLQHPDKGNHGAGATRNLGLVHASQEFIAFLDADDYYLPNRFEVERELFKNPQIEGVFGAIGTAFLSEKGKEEFKAKFNTEITTVNYPASGKEVFEGLIGVSDKPFGVFFSLIALTVRKSSILKNKLKFNTNLRVHQDTDFIVRLSYHCHLQTGEIKNPISIRGVHDDNRITKVKRYSKDFYQKQLILRESLYRWAKQEKLPSQYMNYFRRYFYVFNLANSEGLNKWSKFVVYLVRDPKILQTKYRYYYLKK